MIGIGKHETFTVDIGYGRAIVFRYMTARESIEYVKRMEESTNEKFTEEVERGLAMLADFATGWRGIDGPFSPEKLGDVLTASQAFELAASLPNKQILTEREQKKSESAAQSNPASCAADAGQADA